MVLSCNICGGDRFEAWRGRPGERCVKCGALARHRIAMAVYQRHLFSLEGKGLKVLHLAPEPSLHPILLNKIGAGYTCADASPERYPHASCLKLYFPESFDIFPDNYFDAILHNHVLEHIPGHYGDHLVGFIRLLKPGGRMIFSVPGPYMNLETVEGGENLASDGERLAKFLQEDHYKLFGADFVSFIADLPGGHVVADGISNETRASLNVRPNKARFFIWEKSL
jgi:phosphoglycolate phosphatase